MATKLKDIFDIEYGNQIDLNKLEIDPNGINFVSRTSKNLGVVCKIAKLENKKLFTKGCITVTLGGEFLLSSFVQQDDFYTAQNIKVLTPKIELTDLEKKFYCYIIKNNRFRYRSHGREANKTLNDILIPSKDEIPPWVYETTLQEPQVEPILNNNYELDTSKWINSPISKLFKIEKGGINTISKTIVGDVPLISSTESNNGVNKFIADDKKLFSGNKITIASNGSVGETFYQLQDFYATGDTNILTPLFEMNNFVAFFFVTIFRYEKYRYDYGRKWGKTRMQNDIIKLPAKENGEPDFEFMENYIKSLPYSKNLE